VTAATERFQGLEIVSQDKIKRAASRLRLPAPWKAVSSITSEPDAHEGRRDREGLAGWLGSDPLDSVNNVNTELEKTRQRRSEGADADDLSHRRPADHRAHDRRRGGQLQPDHVGAPTRSS